MAEEFVSEALALVCATNEAWDFREGEAAIVVEVNDAELGDKGGEGVLGDLGVGGGDA